MIYVSVQQNVEYRRERSWAYRSVTHIMNMFGQNQDDAFETGEDKSRRPGTTFQTEVGE